MRALRSRGVLVALGVALAVAAVGRDTGHAMDARRAAAACPDALVSGPRAPENVLAAARRSIRAIHGGSDPALARDNRILQVIALATPPPEGPPRYRRIAARRCGATVADRSWAVVVYFPREHIPSSERVAFFALTRAGWRLWHRF